MAKNRIDKENKIKALENTSIVAEKPFFNKWEIEGNTYWECKYLSSDNKRFYYVSPSLEICIARLAEWLSKDKQVYGITFEDLRENCGNKFCRYSFTNDRGGCAKTKMDCLEQNCQVIKDLKERYKGFVRSN